MQLVVPHANGTVGNHKFRWTEVISRGNVVECTSKTRSSMASSSCSVITALLRSAGPLRFSETLPVCQRCRRAISTTPASWRFSSTTTSKLEDQAPGLRVQSFRNDRDERKGSRPGRAGGKPDAVENVYLRGRSKALEQYAHLNLSPQTDTSGLSRSRLSSADPRRSGSRGRREVERPVRGLARLSEALEAIRGSAEDSARPPRSPRPAGTSLITSIQFSFGGMHR